jgi:hypothetical protein
MLLEVGKRIARGVRVVLDRHLGDLPGAHAVSGHQHPGDEARQRRHGGPIGALVGIDGPADDLGHAGGRQVRHLLAAHHQHGAPQAGRDLGEPRVEGGSARRRGRLDTQRGHVGEAHVGGDVGGKVAVAEEFLRIHRRHDDARGGVDASLGQRRLRRFGHELWQRLAPPPDPGHAHARDEHALHEVYYSPNPPRRRVSRRAAARDLARRVGTVATHLVECDLDQLTLEVADGAVIAQRGHEQR